MRASDFVAVFEVQRLSVPGTDYLRRCVDGALALKIGETLCSHLLTIRPSCRLLVALGLGVDSAENVPHRHCWHTSKHNDAGLGSEAEGSVPLYRLLLSMLLCLSRHMCCAGAQHERSRELVLRPSIC